MLVLFWVSLGLLAWLFVGYPAFVLVRGRLLKRSYKTGDQTPTVAIIVAAYNEANSIGERIENLLAMDYPQEHVQLIVASDGSTDGTVAAATQFENRGVKVLDLPRAGKIPALNEAMQHATAEIVVMTDANSHFPPQTVRALVRPFVDEKVGGVAGNQVYSNNKQLTSGDAERLYWHFDRRLKRALSNSWSVVSATGAIYAIRRALVQTIPSAVTDDFYTSTGVIAAGKRLVFAPEAIAIEPVAEKSTAEFARKVRVMTRGFHALWTRRALLNPFRTGLYAFDLFTYKLLKRLIAVPLLLMLISSAVLASESPIFAGVFVFQIAAYGFVLLSYLLSGTRLGKQRLFAVAAYLGMVNMAALMALLNSIRGRRIDRWEPQRNEQQGGEVASESTRMEVAR